MTGLFSKLLDTSGQSVSYMIEKITYICRNLKKRTPGSKGERETAEYLAAVLKEECGCDRVKLESFREHPDSFYGYFFLSTVCDVLCTLCYFISPWSQKRLGRQHACPAFVRKAWIQTIRDGSSGIPTERRKI